MVIFDELKSIGKTLQEVGKIEQYQQIFEIQKELLEIQKKNSDLEIENKDLKGKLSLRGNVIFEKNSCWILKDDGIKEGPYCHHCWEANEKLIHLKCVGEDYDMTKYGHCSECKDSAKGAF